MTNQTNMAGTYEISSFHSCTVDKNTSRSERNDKMKELLRTAVNTYDMPQLSSLIQQKPIKFYLELSAYWAAKNGNYDTLIELNKHIRPNLNELIEIAAYNGHQLVVDYILDKNDNDGRLLETAFRNSIQGDNLDLVKDIMNRGLP